MTRIAMDPRVDRIQVPVHLRVRRLREAQEKECRENGCSDIFFEFGTGYSPFPIPSLLSDSLIIQDKPAVNRDPLGLPELREATAGFFKRHYHIPADPKRMVIGPGTKALIHSLFTLLNGSVIVPSPGWLGYLPLLRILNKPYYRIYGHRRNNYKIRAPILRAMLNGLVKTQHLLILNNPVNPTGLLYTKKELEDIAEVCRDNNTLILADEVYGLTAYDPEKFVSMGSIYPEGTFVLNGLSFDRSTGFRTGVCLMPEDSDEQLLDEIGKILATYYSYATIPVQQAAVLAYEKNDQIETYIARTRSIFRIMGEHLAAMGNTIDGVHMTKPEAGFFFMADLNDLNQRLKQSGIPTSNDLAPALIRHPYHISAATGEAMMAPYGDYYIRFSVTDYDGSRALQEYSANPPRTPGEEEAFFSRFGQQMLAGMKNFRRWREDLGGFTQPENS